MAFDPTKRKERECRRCGRLIKVTNTNHLRAHACPHKRDCVLTAAARFRGERVERCPACFATRQLELPFA